MASITFSGGQQGDAITIGTGDDVGRNLLAVARDRGIPILFTCSAGACGACLVEIVSMSDESGPPLGEEEALILNAMGKLPPAVGSGTAAGGTTFRLACQYTVPDADIVVRYPRAFGSV